MKLTLTQLRRIIKEEVQSVALAKKHYGRKSLSEAHARITSKELEAWRNGDWGYVSENDEVLDDDFDLL